MNFDSVVERRKSVRKFKSKKVSFRLLMEAVDTASQGPFAGNDHHLKYLIVEDKDKIKKVAEQAEQDWIGSAPALVLVCSDDSNLENQFGMRGRVYSRQQAGAAVYAFMLKLAELGVGSCWVGAYTDSAIRKIFSIPKEVQIEAIIPVGFSMDSKSKVKKKRLERLIFWEEWDVRRRPTIVEEEKVEYRPE